MIDPLGTIKIDHTDARIAIYTTLIAERPYMTVTERADLALKIADRLVARTNARREDPW